MVARLTHARLFGSDSTYVDRSLDELVEDMRQIEREYEVEDEQFLFGQNGKNVQLVVYNQGEETIRDASLSIAIPNHAEFHVAKNAPKVPTDDEFELIVMEDIDKADSPGRYPSVSLNDKAVKVIDKLGDIPPGEFVDVFDVPLRLYVGDGLQGKRFGMQYSLTARNMRTPAKGKLRLLF